MGLLLLLAAGILAYLYFTGQLTDRLVRQIGAGALGIVAVRFLVTGQQGAGLAVGAIAIAIAFWGKTTRRTQALGLDEAREILGVPAGASAEEIRAAYRRIIAQVHPDKGGSPYLSRRVTAARDILLKHVNQTPPKAS